MSFFDMTIRDIVKSIGISVTILILIFIAFIMGQTNAKTIENTILKYCGVDVNYSIGFGGASVGLWKENSASLINGSIFAGVK